MSQPKAIRSILEQTLKALDMCGPLKTYSLWGSWREVVGESIAAPSHLDTTAAISKTYPSRKDQRLCWRSRHPRYSVSPWKNLFRSI